MYGDENSMRLHYFFIVDNFLLGTVDYNPIARFLIFFLSRYKARFLLGRHHFFIHVLGPRFTPGIHGLRPARAHTLCGLLGLGLFFQRALRLFGRAHLIAFFSFWL